MDELRTIENIRPSSLGANMKGLLCRTVFYWSLLTAPVLMQTGSVGLISSSMWDLLTPEQKYDAYTCIPVRTCKTIKERIGSCRCDDICIIFNDCCVGATTTVTTKSEKRSHAKCVHKKQSKTIVPYNFITKCPINYTNITTKMKCERMITFSAIDQIPVSSKLTSIPYLNRFCAMCHGVTGEDMDLWMIKIVCSETYYDIRSFSMSKFLHNYKNTSDCNYKHVPKLPHYGRMCVPESIHLVDHCPPSYTGPLIYLCENYQNFITIEKNGRVFKRYRNIYCLQCDNTPVKLAPGDQLTIVCSPVLPRDKFGQGLLSIFDFSALLFKSRTTEGKLDCEENEVDIQVQCAKLHCPGQYVPSYGECVPYNGHTNVMKLDAMFILTDITEFNMLRNNIYGIINSARDECLRRSIFSIFVSDKSEIYYGMNHRWYKQCMYLRFEAVLKSMNIIHSIEEIEICLQDFLQYSTFKISKDIEILYTENVNDSICSTNQTLIFPPRLLSLPSLAMSSLINCPAIRVFQRESKPDKEVHQVIYSIGSTALDPSDVDLTKNGSFICLDIFREKYDVLDKGSPLYDVYSTYISYTCILASVIILIVTLLHYYFVPGLFNQYSVVLFHLVVLMIVSHSMYLISIYIHFCYWAAILKHFLFLSMFMSMSLSLLNITLHICRMKLPTTKKVAVKTFMRYVVPGYILSASIVMVTALINKFQYPWQQWYGGSSCFLSDAKILFMTFAIPIIVCIVFNICLFCYVMCFFRSINSTLDRTTTFRRNNFFILIKLSSVTGAGWLLGFVAVLTQYKPLVYAFEGMASLQGLFLSFSILNCNTVSRWYKNRCCSQCRGRTSGVSTTNDIQGTNTS